MATYTLNTTARNIINALQAGKNILIHIVDGDETYATPTYINFNTTSGSEEFSMRVPIGTIDSLSFSTSNLDIPLTYESSGGDVVK